MATRTHLILHLCTSLYWNSNTYTTHYRARFPLPNIKYQKQLKVTKVHKIKNVQNRWSTYKYFRNIIKIF